MRAIRVSKGTVYPWVTDPSLLIDDHNVSLIMVPPEGLDDFISPNELKCPIRVIHGPKGSGKTSVLLAKRILLQDLAEDRKVLCIPAKRPFLFMSRTDSDKVKMDSWDIIGAYSQKDTWTALWRLIFGAYVIATLNLDKRPLKSDRKKESSHHEPKDFAPLLPQELGEFLLGVGYGAESDIAVQPADAEIMKILTHIISEKRATLVMLRNAYNTHVLPVLENLAKQEDRIPIFIFVDGVDEIFQGMKNDTSLLITSKSESDVDSEITDEQRKQAMSAWVYAQTSLLSASLDLSTRTGGVVRLIASMRSEAYNYEPFAKSEAQLEGIVMPVKYTTAELKEIFRANIHACDSNLYVSKSGDEFTKFFGTNKYVHYSSRKEEEIFAAILRHTMEEPRDLMLIGTRLYKLSVEERKDFEIASDIVNEATSVIFDDYLKFMGVPWNALLADLTLHKIHSNVLSNDDLQGITDQVSSESNGVITQPFFYLYSLGLIGTIRNKNGKLTQEFKLPARFTKGNPKRLPSSLYYFVHPILAEKIKVARDELGLDPFISHGQVIVGNGSPFELYVDQSKVVLGVVEVMGTKFPVLRIHGISVGYDYDLGSNFFADFNNFETIVVFSFLLALARKWLQRQKVNFVSDEDIFKAMDQLVKLKLVPSKLPRRSLADPIALLKHILDQPRYPKVIQTINLKLVACNLPNVRFSVRDKNKYVELAGMSSNDITVENILIRDQ